MRRRLMGRRRMGSPSWERPPPERRPRPLGRTLPRPAAAATLLLALLLALPAGAGAQTTSREMRDSQERLEQIRRERAQLQREMDALTNRVRDASHELANLERQAATSALALTELEFQTSLLTESVETTSRELLTARERLTERTAVLRHRLRSIYKEGPLHTVRVLLSARSFADLLNRYKYLHLITLYDRVLLEDITSLETGLAEREAGLRADLFRLESLREEKADEVAALERAEDQAKQALSTYRRQGQQTESRLSRLEAEQRRVADAIAALERARLEEERRRAMAGEASVEESSIGTRDLGSLEWPVEGDLLYRFGPERRPNGVVLRWNGIGIRAPAGTPVHAVEDGIVVHAAPTEGYGLSVWISHGGGYYTLYLHLKSLAVSRNQRVEARQVVGTVGGEGTPEGAHMEFQVRMPLRGGVPEAVDPLGWLRGRNR
ncbi:MAG TPA: peptidoglycan DD-metalloendopeptidase family protein [Longimicrobiales bacterium]|nr:peptidoglycan DD-metalloendopeptidase family protein [Longimicrobiales bacterium]